jgi:hypothetical protein
MGEKERGVGGSYGGGVSRGASQASSGAEWAVWDVWDSGGRAEHRVGTFMYDGEMHCQRREKGRVRVARRGTRPTLRRVQTNMPGSQEGLVGKEGFWPLKILGARFPPSVSVATGAADESDAATGPRDEMVGEAEERESGPLANGAENGEEVRLSGF